jgi:glycosyltransferase involved in cell wall biosynthesis
LAGELGADPFFVHYLKFQNPIYAPFKYILQTLRTLQILFSKKPKVVFVQNPPFIAGLSVYLYCRLQQAHFVLDHHSAAFAAIWNWALPVQKFLAQRAITNLVTNQHWADIIRSWSAEYFVMIDPLPQLTESQHFDVKLGFNIVFINTFADDEPLEEVLKAALQLPEVQFYITGNTNRKPDSFFANIPPNIIFTGFLPYSQYVGLLKAAQAVMTLTTRDFTLQGGGFEAIALGKPLLVSDWPYLQGLFAQGSVYVANSAEAICQGILAVQENYETLEKEMIVFGGSKKQEWSACLVELKQIIDERLALTEIPKDIHP